MRNKQFDIISTSFVVFVYEALWRWATVASSAGLDATVDAMLDATVASSSFQKNIIGRGNLLFYISLNIGRQLLRYIKYKVIYFPDQV